MLAVVMAPCDISQHGTVGRDVPGRGQQGGSHAPGGQGPAAVAGLHQEVHVAAEETLLHVDVLTAVREEEGLPVSCRGQNHSPLTHQHLTTTHSHTSI